MMHDHIKNLMNLGFLLDSDTADIVKNLDEENFYRLVEGLKNEKSVVLSKQLIKRILSKEVNVIRTFKPVQSFTVQDFVKTLNERYSFLQKILLNKLELSNVVSINKFSSGDASIIGLVKTKEEKDDNYILILEDPTGEVQAIIPKNLGEKLSLDDVVAVSGRINNKILFADNLIFPDVPLRPVTYSQENVKLAFSDEKIEQKIDYLISKDRIEDKIKNKTYDIVNPSIFEIEGVKILLIFDLDPLEILKKRYITIGNTDFLIEPVPDIVFTNKEINTNYKGISIASKNKIVDLKTREVQSI
jgi:DNA polymerase II small subunit/DNA polymerase delta subunit B